MATWTDARQGVDLVGLPGLLRIVMYGKLRYGKVLYGKVWYGLAGMAASEEKADRSIPTGLLQKPTTAN